MIKEERLLYILDLLSKKDIVRVSDIVNNLNVSDMTVRRDLDELEALGKLKRVHGGAIANKRYPKVELSHKDKKIINIDEKEELTDIAAKLINDLENENIYLGPGTTIELLARKIKNTKINVYTNCIPIFLVLIENNVKSFLLGGELRKKTMSFNGDITNRSLEVMKFHKAFFSCNGIIDNEIMTATSIEGYTQKIALDNSVERYLLVDNSKFGQKDFYTYYNTKDLTGIITNIDKDNDYISYSEYTDIFSDIENIG